uniref:Uncharacterized protein n=1 Tax=Arundo donax TaxID=35708 RepID=A0A0A9CXA3_ARUDO
MAASSLRHLILLLVVVAVASACLGAAAAHQAGSGEGYTIAGRIKIDGEWSGPPHMLFANSVEMSSHACSVARFVAFGVRVTVAHYQARCVL